MSEVIPLPRIQCRPSGPCPSPLMIVGEAPGDREVQAGVPFVGPSGWLLDTLLEEAGLHRSRAFITNVLAEQPPENDLLEAGWVARKVKQRTTDHRLVKGEWVDSRVRYGLAVLEEMVLECRPTVVVAMGNLALWALAGKWGIRNWRSSVLQGQIGDHKFKIIPTIHPAAVLREWPLRPTVLHDLRQVARELERGGVVSVPQYQIITRPSFPQASATLSTILSNLGSATAPIRLAADIETRAGHIACLGIAWSKTEAICVPFMCVERPEGYWTLEEEAEMIRLTRQILTHPKAFVIGQNWVYDRQYLYRWHFYIANMGLDTMVTHHAMFSASPKGLGYLSSLYCEHHEYWKDDGRLWDPSKPEEEYWYYNGEDCCRTFEISVAEEEAITTLAQEGWTRLPEVVAFQTRLQTPVLKMMLRGVRSNEAARAALGTALLSRIREIQGELEAMTGQPLNPKSPKQMQEFFYDGLGFTPIRKRQPNGKWSVTCDADALQTLALREPLVRPLVARIEALRSAGVFLSTFVNMARDWDGRLRCSYNTAGTVTYRFASSENAFGSGGNLQNVPIGDEDEDLLIPLPNIRNLFLFDPGMTGFDLDGDSADLRIVTGESGCRAMQAYFAAGAKPYVEIAKEFYRDPRVTKADRRYKLMKALCHGSNYGGEGAGLASRIGLGVHDTDRIQAWYFGMCPEIKAWQEDVAASAESRGWVENPFGYRMHYSDRWSRKIRNEALAAVPQSTVGILINKILVAIDEGVLEVELLLQVHDSLTGQYPTHLGGLAERRILEVARVEIPCRYERVVVPMQLKKSRTSWGECK